MRRCQSVESLQFDPEIDRTFHRLIRENRNRREFAEVEMAGNEDNQIQATPRALRDYTVPVVAGSAIRRPTIQANNYELKPSLIQMVQSNQFGGYPNESPDDHIAVFL